MTNYVSGRRCQNPEPTHTASKYLTVSDRAARATQGPARSRRVGREAPWYCGPYAGFRSEALALHAVSAGLVEPSAHVWLNEGASGLPTSRALPRRTSGRSSTNASMQACPARDSRLKDSERNRSIAATLALSARRPHGSVSRMAPEAARRVDASLLAGEAGGSPPRKLSVACPRYASFAKPRSPLSHPEARATVPVQAQGRQSAWDHRCTCRDRVANKPHPRGTEEKRWSCSVGPQDSCWAG